ncbi:MAG: KpsF/GutQ family sugar-phosphate isomerase [Rhodospirillaceae bacterium]|nr:KpsF/GutQ family sugar-phosphate isomerase [Rhodospirillaceae bacterium]
MSTTAPKTAPSADPIAAAQRVFKIAADGIQALSASLGAEFSAAIETLGTAKGRIIVSGMGKSAHVARKIAATLASTGTPAHFVHAAEASHGDLGMIANDDAVIALSNSGETPELADLIEYTRRFGIKLIAITSKRNSSLGTAADVVLALPPTPEACPLGLAPTTSTTLMISLGDAIAVALMERRGFTADEYKVFHPGGKLGRRLLKVKDLMHGATELPLVQPTSSMPDTILVMTQKTFGIAGVIENGKLAGVVTDGDLRRHMQNGLLDKTAADIMSKTPRTTNGNTMAQEALRLMNEWKVACLFVVEDGAPVGIIRLHDILRAGAA